MGKRSRRSVLFIVRGDDTVPSCRFRAWQFLEPLRRSGIDARCVILEKSRNPIRQLLFHLKLIRLLRRHHAIVFQKLLEPRRLSFIRFFNRNLYYDFDDAMYLAEDGDDFPATMRAAPHILAGNPILAEKARRYNADVAIIPTVVPVPDPAPEGLASPGGGSFVLSWIGTAGMNMPYLIAIVEILDGMAGRLGDFELRILTDKPDLAPRRDWIKAMKWSRQAEDEEFRRCDVGLMPLPDTEWCEGKCACKALQYLSYGKPIVTSPVGVNKDLFADRSFAALADRPEAWRAALGRFRSDAALRVRVGAEGRAFVAEEFSVDVWAPKLAAHLGVD